VATVQFGVVKVTEVMSRKVVTVTADTHVKEAGRLLVELGISALPVVDAKGVLVGIVSKSDMAPTTKASTAMAVADVMTTDVLTVAANSEVSKAARIMLESGVERLPVVHGRRVVGIVSRGDLVRVLARDVPVQPGPAIPLRRTSQGR
jgi:CBS domain-containing protein